MNVEIELQTRNYNKRKSPYIQNKKEQFADHVRNEPMEVVIFL